MVTGTACAMHGASHTCHLGACELLRHSLDFSYTLTLVKICCHCFSFCTAISCSLSAVSGSSRCTRSNGTLPAEPTAEQNQTKWQCVQHSSTPTLTDKDGLCPTYGTPLLGAEGVNRVLPYTGRHAGHLSGSVCWDS